MSQAPTVRGHAPPFWTQACSVFKFSVNEASSLQNMDFTQFTDMALDDFKQLCPSAHPLPSESLLPLCDNPLPQNDSRIGWMTANTLWCLASHTLSILLTHLSSRWDPLYLHASRLHLALDKACAVFLLLHTQGRMSIVASPFATQVTWHVARLCRSLIHMKLNSSKGHCAFCSAARVSLLLPPHVRQAALNASLVEPIPVMDWFCLTL